MGYKANVDASVLKNGGTGVGMVVRDKEGKFVMAAVRRTRVTWQPEIAEAEALLWGLKLIQQHQLYPAMMEMDCLSLIYKLQGKDEINLEIGTLCEEIRERAQGKEIQWRFLGREGNESAHQMARVNCRWEETEVWFDRPPIFLLPQLLKDCNAIAPHD
ncbi:unnamed protein product [Linum trigynum]|uniref:RNase H type-1 domain-containing protein n=1 Tax=Linum trigynum TaxID=586398 RepID=A0AAV2CL55_9ROSI